MTEENPSSSFIGKLAEEADSVIGTASGKSGQLDELSVDDSILVFPSDLGDAKSTNGILNWVEFTSFSKENGSISSVVKKIGNAVGFGGGDEKNQTDEANSELKETQSLIDKFTDGGSTKKANQQEVISDSRLGRAESSPGNTISLYLPGGIEYSDGLQYEEVGFAGIKNLSSASATIGTASLGLLRKAAGVADKAAGLLGQESLNAGRALSAELGVVVNPRKEQMFNGIDMRTFSFNFVFIPRNEKEAESMQKIIKCFRFHAHPELSANSAFFNFPSEFDIKFKTYDFSTPSEAVKENPTLPKIGRCFIDKISTNYTPDDVYHAFKNGVPPKVTLSLSFKEAEYITRNHVNQGF